MNYKGAVETVSSAHSRAILIFAKMADPGNVKTRLQPAVGEEGSLRVHLALVQDTLAVCTEVPADTLLYAAGESGFPFPVAAPIRPQTSGDLGARLQAAFQENLRHYRKVLVIGIDAPGITPSLLKDAFDLLDAHEVVLGPTEDGGYYLVGMTKMIPEIFTDIPWSTANVFEVTLQRLKDRPIGILPRLFDIDEPDDLDRLKRLLAQGEFPHAHHIRDTLKAK